MTKKSIIAAAMLAVLSLLPATAFAGPLTFTFEQTGFSENAVISGWFNGTDLDDNGQLSFLDGEIDDFYVSFSGNSFVPMFELLFADLSYLVYNLHDGYLGNLFDDEGIEAIGVTHEYAAGPAIFFSECGIGFDCAYVAGPEFSNVDFSAASIAVSEPATTMLLLTGLLGAGLIRRRRASNIG